MAESAVNVDSECIKCFQMFVAKEHANSSTLSEAEKKFGKTTTVRKILKDCLGESNEMIRLCESTIYPKYQEKKTKKISDETFIEKVLPDLAALKTKKGDNPDIILKKWKTKMVENVGKEETKTKNADVVNRLTDTSKYTGSHKERFDEEGKGRGAAGTEDRVENKGYVSGYKGQGTYGQKK